MAIDRVTSVSIRPDRVVAFQQRVGELAAEAAGQDESWHWTAHQTVFGEGMMMHFASRVENFAEIETQGHVDELWTRVLGEARGTEAMSQANECMVSVEQTISIERPDLSYADDIGDPQAYPYAVITAARSRPGHAEACEELIRKVAEAIPKVGDPARMLAYQVVFGDMGAYWTVRPLRNLGDLDRQLPPTELLNQAFGNSEGGLLWRTGSEAILESRRSVVRYTPELSNPPIR